MVATEQDDRGDGAKPRPQLTPEQRRGSLIQSVLATEDGREFVKMIIDEYSVNRSPVPNEHSKMQRSLPPVEATIYNLAQQDVARWLIGLCAKHSPARFREMAIEAYIRGATNGGQP